MSRTIARRVALTASIVSAALLAATDASAQAKHYKLAFDQPMGTGYGVGGTIFADKLKELSKGSMIIDMYPGGQLGQEPQVLQLKEKNPDVLIFISYTSDAILYTKTMKELNWKPSIMIADNAGFNDPAFVKNLANQVEGLVNRSAFSAGKAGSVPDLFNKLYVKKTGGEFFSGGDEATIIKAIQSIDRRAAGKIEMKQYSTEKPRFAPFAAIAAFCDAARMATPSRVR